MYYVKIYYGPSLNFYTVSHKPQKLRGLRDQLMKLGYRVDLIPVSCRDYCMIEMTGQQVFVCNINNLRFNTPHDLDAVCQRAIQAVENANVQINRAKDFFWLRHYINDQMFKRTEFAPKENWPFELVVPPITSCEECARCCGILVADKTQETPEEPRPHYRD